MNTTEEIKISEYDLKGNKTEYDVIMIYDSDVTDKRYIFYTDGKKSQNGRVGVKVGFVEETDGNVTITSITNPIEQEMLSRVYAEHIQDNKFRTVE
ncbi:MAG: DUF1292 domain-containing protein [Clostridia bacterium]|nr:DUF1292 domain-containing protein [Clostridia bacterium]